MLIPKTCKACPAIGVGESGMHYHCARLKRKTTVLCTLYEEVEYEEVGRPANKPEDVFKYINIGDDNECWEWKRSLHRGRPYFEINGKKSPAYRIVYQLFYGVTLDSETLVRHKCDNPKCCNPHHLEEGTHEDNMRDMVERERHGMPKTAVRAILKLLEQGKTHQSIADLYGVSRETVTAINNGRRSLPDDDK